MHVCLWQFLRKKRQRGYKKLQMSLLDEMQTNNLQKPQHVCKNPFKKGKQGCKKVHSPLVLQRQKNCACNALRNLGNKLVLLLAGCVEICHALLGNNANNAQIPNTW